MHAMLSYKILFHGVIEARRRRKVALETLKRKEKKEIDGTRFGTPLSTLK